jgi:hypothetical protein
VVLLPGATQLQAKDIAWRLKASQADCVVADPETAIKVSHSKKVSGLIFYTVLLNNRANFVVHGNKDL